MPGVAQLAAIRMVVDRERVKKKTRTDRTRFERFITGLVQETMKTLEDDKAASMKTSEWRNTYYKTPPELPASPGRTRTFWYRYDMCAFYLNHWVVQTTLFDLFIFLNIIAVGVAVGLSLDGYEDENPAVTPIFALIETFTFWVFIVEAVHQSEFCDETVSGWFSE